MCRHLFARKALRHYTSPQARWALRRLTMTAERLILFNKPYLVLCQFTDPEGRPTLADYISLPAVYAAGRLDFDSEGLLLLTSAGWLQNQIADPRHKLPKTYWVQVEGIPSPEALRHLARGVTLKDGPTLPAEVSVVELAAGGGARAAHPRTPRHPHHLASAHALRRPQAPDPPDDGGGGASHLAADQAIHRAVGAGQPAARPMARNGVPRDAARLLAAGGGRGDQVAFSRKLAQRHRPIPLAPFPRLGRGSYCRNRDAQTLRVYASLFLRDIFPSRAFARRRHGPG